MMPWAFPFRGWTVGVPVAAFGQGNALQSDRLVNRLLRRELTLAAVICL